MISKSKFPFIAGCLVLLLLVYSCRKNISNFINEPTNPAVDWAKDYYKQSLLTASGNIVNPLIYNKNMRLMGVKPQKRKNRKIPIWENAVADTTTLYSFVEIPIKYDTKITPIINVLNTKSPFPNPSLRLLKASLTRLIIYKNKRGDINQKMISYIPSEAYLQKAKGDISHNKINKLDKNFEGYLVYREWDGTLLFSLIIKNGRAVGRIAFNSKNPINFKPVKFKREQVCVTVEVFEIFQTCSYVGDDPNPVSCDDPYRESIGIYDVCWDDGYGNDPCADPANLDLGLCQGSEGEFEFEEVNPHDLVKEFCLGLTAQQKQIITSTLDALKDYDCASKYITNKFAAANKSFDFCIESISGNASYNPADKSFKFSTDYAASRTDIMEHELFHAFQDDQYPGGTSQYGRINGEAQSGFANIEFEQALITDVMHGSTSAFDTYGSQEQQTSYRQWIDQLTNNGTSFPKLSASGGTAQQIAAYNSFIAQYNAFLNAFNNMQGNPYHSQILNLDPLAFINLFKSINPNC